MASAPRSIAIPKLTDEMYARGRKSGRHNPFEVVAARYSRAYDSLQLTLRDGIVVSLPRRQIRELAKARPADISVPGLLTDELGSIFAREMGRKTRGRTSVTKAAASRENGRKGGRPPKGVAA